MVTVETPDAINRRREIGRASDIVVSLGCQYPALGTQQLRFHK